MPLLLTFRALPRLFLASLCLPLASFCLAEASDAGNALPPRALPDLPLSREQAVNHHLTLLQRAGESLPLNAGNEIFYGLLLTERSGQPQGGVLILPDDGQHGHWPDVIAPLREYLPEYGWTTLSISLPDTPAAQRPAREPAVPAGATPEPAGAADTPEVTPEENDRSPAPEQPATAPTDSNGLSLSSEGSAETETDNEPPLPPLTALPPQPVAAPAPPAAIPAGPSAAERYQQQMQQRIDRAVALLNERGQLNLVIVASGHSAAWAIDWLQQQQRKSGTQARGLTLVLVDALEDAYAPVQLSDGLAELSLPVLDLITPFNRNHAFTNRQRAGLMKHRQRQDYQQIVVPSLALSDRDTGAVSRRIRGWLKTHAAGMELDQAQTGS